MSVWTDTPKEVVDKEFEFWHLLMTYWNGKTADPKRLRWRIQDMWYAFPEETQKLLTERMITGGYLSPDTVSKLRIIDGMVATFL
jgi:hypothetical protein